MKTENESIISKKCISCRSDLNEGASRCSSCGRFIGLKGEFFYYSSFFAAIASLISIVTIAFTGYVDVLASRSPDLNIKVSEATFVKIHNLTCDPENLHGEKPDAPSTYGDPPGKQLRVEGTIENKGNLAGELRIDHGLIMALNPNVTPPILAEFSPDPNESRFFVGAGSTVSFSIISDVYSISSDGYNISEIDVLPRFKEALRRQDYFRHKIVVEYYTYESGSRIESNISQELDFYLEPFSKGWRVDGGPYDSFC